MNFSKLLKILFPPRCVCCDNITDNDFPVCDGCVSEIIHPEKSTPACDICFMPLRKCVCTDHCFYSKFCSPLYYKGKARHTIHRYKFRGRPDLAENYAKLMLYALNEREMLRDIDIITYIPMSRRSRFLRGYNQSELIAKGIAAASGKECIGLLTKYRQTVTQHSLKKLNRSGNLLGAYEPDKKYLDKIRNNHILIIDDVCTTGNTLNEAAKTLLIFDARQISAASCAVAEKNKKMLITKK